MVTGRERRRRRTRHERERHVLLEPPRRARLDQRAGGIAETLVGEVQRGEGRIVLDRASQVVGELVVSVLLDGLALEREVAGYGGRAFLLDPAAGLLAPARRFDRLLGHGV